jgi:hypothetical protein
MAIATPPNRLTAQRHLCRTGLMVMRVDAVTMRLSDLQLTPARVGLILLMLLLFGAIVFRVVTASEYRRFVRPALPRTAAELPRLRVSRAQRIAQ